MERKTDKRDCGQGELPNPAPLANPYVPFQMENPSRYEPRKALIRGTAYPGLDLPFMGMINQKEKPITPMSELQVLAFMIQELALYLDTHRDDEEALELYRSYQEVYHKCMMQYSQDHAPLSHCIPVEGPYRWLNDPWPWEYARNKEG